MGSRNSNNFPYFIISRVDYCFNEKDMIFSQVLHRSLVWIFTHKSTMKIMEDTFVKLMEDPKTNEIMERCLEQALLNYAKNSGYKL